MITEQLRYAGVLEAVRVFRVGYHSNEDEAVLGTNLFLESNIGNISNSVSGKEIKAVNTVQRLREKKASTKIRTW